MEKITDAVMSEKPRYAILDGLRGVAAVIVVAFHLFETYSKGPAYQILNHGYLAVDFFFVLSGFVIGYAYDNRWGKMSTLAFFKRRLIRLHPMVIMGSAIGALLFYFGNCERFPLIDQTAWWQTAHVSACLYDDTGAYQLGYTRLARDQSAQWAYLVAHVGISGEYSLCFGRP